MNTRMVRYIVAVVGFVVIVAGSWYLIQQAQERSPEPAPEKEGPIPTASTARAAALYQQECVVCHGSQGRGDGEAAYLLFPKPRDFTTGAFKLRSTPSGEAPTEDDLFKTITNGMPGSAMPSFAHLPESDRSELARHVKTFFPSNLPEPAEALVPPPPPSPTDEMLARGEALYSRMGCVMCHGESGRADGPSSDSLVDDYGRPIRANDFTRGIYKGGGADEDIYLRFATGMMGTPMPSYKGIMTDDEAYALVYYVKSLSGGAEPAVQPKRTALRATRVAGAIPEDPTSAAWANAPEATIPLMTLHQRQESSADVQVRALHNGSEVAIRLSWDDAEPDAGLLRHQDFSDAAAVQFPLGHETTLETLTMGSRTTPVNIWYWNAARQMDAQKFRDVEVVYPNMAADDYPFAPAQYPKTLDPDNRFAVPSAARHEKTFLTGWGAGNPVSNPLRALPVEEANAVGFGSLTTQPETGQKARGVGIWDSGVWTVVFARSVASEETEDAQFAAGKSIPVAFAVWDGSGGDRNGQKSVTVWNDVTLAP